MAHPMGLLRRAVVFGIILVMLAIVCSSSSSAQEGEIEPSGIRVWMNTLPGQPIRVVTFSTTYIHRVLAAELGGRYVWDPTGATDYPVEDVRAMAVAVRSLAWYYIRHPLNANYHVTEQNPQRYLESDTNVRALLTDAANHTNSVIAAYSATNIPFDPIWAGHYSRTGNPTTDWSETAAGQWPCGGNYPGGDRSGNPFRKYLISVPNPMDPSRACPAPPDYHYVGLGQLSSGNWAAGSATQGTLGGHWPQIITQFFRRAFLQRMHGFTGNYRARNTDGTCATTTLAWRTDPYLNFEWGQGQPHPSVPADNFCVTWTSNWTVPETGWYTFFVEVDDGVRLFANNQRIINAWNDQAFTFYTGSIHLLGGANVPIRMEYYDGLGNATAKLSWIRGQGLAGEYHDDIDPYTGNIKFRRADPDLYFNWASAKPDARISSNNNFSVHWFGNIRADTTRSYVFTVTSDDGVRLLVNGNTIVDQWYGHPPTTYVANYTLNANTLNRIDLYYYEFQGDAGIQFSWQQEASAGVLSSTA